MVKRPIARPGQIGLACGACGDALMLLSRHTRTGPDVWSCQRCLALWEVPPVEVTRATVAEASKVAARRHG